MGEKWQDAIHCEHSLGQKVHEANYAIQIWKTKEQKKDPARKADGIDAKVLGQAQVSCQ